MEEVHDRIFSPIFKPKPRGHEEIHAIAKFRILPKILPTNLNKLAVSIHEQNDPDRISMQGTCGAAPAQGDNKRAGIKCCQEGGQRTL